MLTILCEHSRSDQSPSSLFCYAYHVYLPHSHQLPGSWWWLKSTGVSAAVPLAQLGHTQCSGLLCIMATLSLSDLPQVGLERSILVIRLMLAETYIHMYKQHLPSQEKHLTFTCQRLQREPKIIIELSCNYILLFQVA